MAQIPRALVFWTALLTSACREPTQVRVELTTDALCDDVRNTSITVAEVDDLEVALPDTATETCSSATGRIGSITLVPTNDDNANFAVRIVTGFGKSADQCVQDGYDGGCIVARRSLRFLAHETLYLPINMQAICKDVPCGATETCSSGKCVDAAIVDVNDCRDADGCDVTNNRTSGTGGVTSSGGTGGGVSGGAPSVGGVTSFGGTATSGGGTGGNSSSGGSPASGGATSSGGSITSGGTATTGGATSTTFVQGGVGSTGGSPNGGTAAGGAPTGGTASVTTGGLANTGGVATGGIATGGVSTGGTATGGNSTGGVATGGVATGGVATGGVATGGVATGGATTLAGTSNGGGAAGSGAMGGTLAAGGTTILGGSAGLGGSATGGSTTVPAVCGDGILAPYAGEYCDTSGESSTCNANCTPQRCGDDLVNVAAGEQCDGQSGGVFCTPACRISTCGDGYVDRGAGEQCEAGLGGCNACMQDLSNQAGALRIAAERDELLGNRVYAKLRITNSGASVSVNGLVARFYYTPDSVDSESPSCEWSDVGCSNVTTRLVNLKYPCTQASKYLEMAISANASLARNANLDLEAKASGGLFSYYNFSNDYSRPASSLLHLETSTITLYQNGKLVWGTPPCGCGNGSLDGSEQCDHEGESAYCNRDCTIATCGDGKVNPSAGEDCDTFGPSLTCDATCRSTGLPASAASFLVQWLDVSRLSSVTLSPRVSAVLDASGRSNHVTQISDAKRPFLFPNMFGGRPALYFDGKSHELVANSPVANTGRGSVFVVHHVAPVGLTATLLANGWASSWGGFAVRTRPQLDGLGLSFGASSGYSTVLWAGGARSGSSPPTPRLTLWTWDPPYFGWISGVESESLTVAATYNTATNPLALGGINASEPFTGWLGELLIFDRVLTVPEQNAILAYLRTKWRVP